MYPRTRFARCTPALALATTLVAAACIAQPAHAALGAAEPLSSLSASIATDPQVDFDANGTASAFYYTQAPLEPSGIVVRTKSGADAWQPAFEVSTGVPVGSFAADVAENGSAIVAWEKPSDLEVWAAYRSSSGVWSSPFQIRDDGPDSLQPAVSVAIDSNGNCVVAWRATGVPAIPGVQATYARYRSATTGSWGPIETISDTADFAGSGLDIEVDSEDRFVAAWLGNGTASIDVATRTAGDGGAWLPPITPDPPAGVNPLGFPKIAADDGGRVAIVWVRQATIPDPPYSNDVLRWVERSSTGTWGTPLDISGPDVEVDRFQTRPQLAFDASGNATAAWIDGYAQADRLRVSTKTSAGSWTTPQTVHDEVGEIKDLSLDVDGVGNAIAAWTREDASDVKRIELSTRDTAGTWSDAENQTPSITPSAPRVAAAGDGGAAAVWSAFEVIATPPPLVYARFSPPIPAPTGGPGNPPATTPAIGRVTISPKKVYRKARIRGSKKKRKTSGKVQFSLSEPAMVTLEFQYRLPGRHMNGKCVRKTRRNLRRRACERISPWGKPISSPAGTGASSISFSAKRLRKGNYYVIVKATAASGATATPVRVKMTVG